MKDSSVDGGDTEQQKFSFTTQFTQPGDSETVSTTAETLRQAVIDEPLDEATVSDADEWVQPAVVQNNENEHLPGKALAVERKRRGISIADIAAQLFLTEAQIIALEADDYDKFPAPIFVTGYIRNYARLLELPADPLVALYNAQNTQASPTLTRTTTPTAKSNPQSFDPRIVAGAVVAIVFVLLLWWGMSSEDEAFIADESVGGDSAISSAELPNSVPEVTATELPQASAIVPITSVQSPPAMVKEERGVEAEATTGSEPAQVVTVEPQEVAPVVDANPDTIVLTFSAESWVEITDANEQRVMFDLGKPGQTRMLSGTAPFNILFGNSPAVTMSYNGESFDQRSVTRSKVARFTLGKKAE